MCTRTEENHTRVKLICHSYPHPHFKKRILYRSTKKSTVIYDKCVTKTDDLQRYTFLTRMQQAYMMRGDTSIQRGVELTKYFFVFTKRYILVCANVIAIVSYISNAKWCQNLASV